MRISDWSSDVCSSDLGTLQVPREQFFAGLKHHGVDTVTVIGVAADYCVMWAIRGLLDRGFKVEVVEHLTAGIQRDMQQTIDEEFPGQVSLIHQGTLSSWRSEEHTSELQSLMRISYAVFCLKKKKTYSYNTNRNS